ncbi:MAG: GTP 3',8-cyclase MoaA [Bacillota bacterium]|nr:GTP 3',8-cyclase MoaA [Bacillota bacterium]
MIDSYGRRINYLRISVTDLCNLRCRYCMPEKGIKKINYENILRLEEIVTISQEFVALGVDKIRITGGEPLVRKNILKLVEDTAKLKGLKELAMTTNGTLLREYAADLKNAGLNRINISLDTLNPMKYRHITKGGRLKDVLAGIEKAKAAGLLPLKLNVVLIKGFNDNEIEDFIKLTQHEEIDVRFIELMPIGEVRHWSLNKYLSNNIILEKSKELISVKNEDTASPAQYFKLPDGKGRVGLINPISCKFCSKCNRIRLTADGKLKNCLHSNEEIDLRNALRNEEDIKKIIINLVNNKPKEHKLEQGDYIDRNMIAIGG